MSLNRKKFVEALDLLKASIFDATVSDDDWIEFGQAVAEAMTVEPWYEVRTVSLSKDHNPNWRKEATRLWKAAGKVGLR